MKKDTEIKKILQRKELIRKLYKIFDKKDYCTYMDENADLLYVHHGLSVIYLDKMSFILGFEVHCDATTAASITQEVIEFASKLNLKVDITDPYADIIDEQGIIQQTLFGDEAIKYYETGEAPVKEEDLLKNPVDAQKKFDEILDQINSDGMDSLNKNQRDFLVRFSKEGTEKKCK